ncbi:efflux RND transporter periplasmic adaptor subunit [Novosphingobium rosa]|uniref:efflux RND transporter periplasmic adaptor subunit n=1 Tax=Novosphingobium rosa TaxID=76978 RepID=UPI000A078E90|nr:efflux RND transporter periplasmic adaptor subunit [Novosphingobium rosa]
MSRTVSSPALAQRQPLLPAPRVRVAITLLLAGSLGLAACSGKGKNKERGPAEVGYWVATESTVPLEVELPGRTAPYRVSQVRPQVSGLIEKRLFEEGAMVKAGQPLYRIDPSLYRAAANQAQANLTSAQASAEAAKIKADRYKPLAASQAVSQQDYTDAAATARTAAASVMQTRAALETARINLHYTTVPAPLTGRISRSAFTDGALVTANQADALATIAVLDPIYVDIQQNAADMMKLRQALADGGAQAREPDVKLRLDDGKDYALPGKLEFSEVTVDSATGTVTLRARFPNPKGLLLPGLFVRARLSQAVQTRVILVPQGAVSRDARGTATVYVVGQGNKAEMRQVTAVRTVGDTWVVTDGIKPGDKVITQGLGLLRPNGAVKPVPENSAQGYKLDKNGAQSAK